MIVARWHEFRLRNIHGRHHLEPRTTCSPVVKSRSSFLVGVLATFQAAIVLLRQGKHTFRSLLLSSLFGIIYTKIMPVVQVSVRPLGHVRVAPLFAESFVVNDPVGLTVCLEQEISHGSIGGLSDSTWLEVSILQIYGWYYHSCLIGTDRNA